MKHKSIFIGLIIILSSLLFIQPQPVKADTLEYKHVREFAYIRPIYSGVITFNTLYPPKTVHWEFTTMMDDMIINATVWWQHSDPYWIERVLLSTNKTHDSGTFEMTNEGVPYPNSVLYRFRCQNIGNVSGYVMMDIWYEKTEFNVEPLWDYYVLPENRTQPLWQWDSRNNFVEQYYAVYTSFQATEYDVFFMTSIPHLAPILFLDQAKFNKFKVDKDPYASYFGSNNFLQMVDMARPTHDDTWYFVFMNGYEEDGINLNVSIRFTPNYYGFPPEPEPEPEPEPIPEPEPYLIPSFNVIAIISMIGITIFIIYKKI